MDLGVLRLVAAFDAVNVVGLTLLSRPHGRAAALGYAPALVGVALVSVHPAFRRLAIGLAVSALLPNTVLALRASDGSRRARRLSAYLAVGGGAIGVGYLGALTRD